MDFNIFTLVCIKLKLILELTVYVSYKLIFAEVYNLGLTECMSKMVNFYIMNIIKSKNYCLF